ncbi:MAG: patatin-like phospholipase family protein [Gemmatimonadetes bacterium]|nr:patatin-like phospholipase family protein [Gemmatimonadota bacterium]
MTGVVFGGGGVRGMAQGGAWRALRDAGVEPDAIVGTSIGSIVAACIAGGDTNELLRRKALEFRKQDIALLNRWVVLLNGIRQSGVFRGETLRQFITRVVPGGSFGELALPVAVNAVDLGTGEEVWFGAGGRADVSIPDAVTASCSLPVFYPPHQVDGRYFVDGGVLDPLPLEHAARLGADRIIAVDVSGGGTRDAATVASQGLVAIHHRVSEIVGHLRRRRLLDTWSGPPLLYIRPRLEAYSTFDFGHTELFLEEGYRAAREALGSTGPEAADRLEAG